MEISEWIRLDEAQHLTGIPVSSLRRRLNQGDRKLIGRQVLLKVGGTKKTWEILRSSLIENKSLTAAAPYERLFEEILSDMASGALTGKPLAKATLDNFRYGMQAFWRFLGQPPALDSVNPANLRLALIRVVGEEEGGCHYGTRQLVYMAVCRFVKFLVDRGYRQASELDLLRAHRPKRSTPVRRTYLYPEQIEEAFAVNRAWIDGRGEFGVALTEIILALGLYAGLRSKEIRTLKLSELNLRAGVLTVEAKGKRREVGITPELEVCLNRWMQIRPDSKEAFLVLQKNGSPLTKRVIARRVQGLAEKLGVDLTPHGLRRSAGGYWEEVKKLNWSELQEMFGHSDINVTKLYVPRDKKSAINKLRGCTLAEPRSGAHEAPQSRGLKFEF